MDIKRIKSHGRPAFNVGDAVVTFDADEATSLTETGVFQFKCPLTASIGPPTLQAQRPVHELGGHGLLDKFPWEE